MLAGVGNRPASRAGRTPPTRTAIAAPAEPTATNNSGPVPGGVRRIEPDPLSKKSGGSVRPGEEAPRGAGGGGGGGRGLYWLLQGARDDAVCTTGNVELGGHGGSSAATSPAEAAAAAELAAAEELAAEISARRKAKKDRNKNKGLLSATTSPNNERRSEVGAGRALFGGFVPSRQAPAASLYDFGSSSTVEGEGHGAGSTGGDFAGVSSLASIYSQRGVVPGGAGSGGGSTLGTLNDARVRQYTQEATTRAQRLGAEKRNSRISKSKRQG